MRLFNFEKNPTVVRDPEIVHGGIKEDYHDKVLPTENRRKSLSKLINEAMRSMKSKKGRGG
jgi:hypothetical protein